MVANFGYPVVRFVLLAQATNVVASASDEYVFKDLPPWGDSLFGEWRTEGSGYRETGVHDVRHVGWSWNHIRTGTPFCSTSYMEPSDERVFQFEGAGCTYPKEECHQVGGHPFDSICMQDPEKPFSVLGPDCWNKKCSYGDVEVSRQTCQATLGGAFVGPQAFGSVSSPYAVDGVYVGGSWCLVPGRHTVLGPACYGDECFTEELATVCEELDGTVYADLYCVLNAKYTVVGPICRPSLAMDIATDACYPQETVETCTAMGGKTVGDIFCVLPDVYSALGPFCSSSSFVDSNSTENCLGDRGLEICNALGGTSFAEGIFCAIKGNDYHFYGAFVGGGCLAIGDSAGGEKSFCESEWGGMNLGSCACVFKGDYTVGAPLRWDDTTFYPEFEKRVEEFPQTGAGFVLKDSYSVYGPNCYGSQCYIATDDCEAAGGMSIGGIFCAIPNSKSKKGFEFTAEEGLPGGVVLIISLLSAAAVVEGILIFWFRRKWRSQPAENENLKQEAAKDLSSSSSPDE